jgi:RNA polymerase sigma-70 factor (ECF subfamily)
MALTGDPDAAADLVQETFIKAHELNAFSDGQLPHPGWLLRVCERICLDYLRREARGRLAHASFAKSLGHAELQESVEDGESDECDDYLSAATDIILALGERKRQIAILHFLLGCRAADIAAQLGLKPRSVWTRLYEVRILLRASLSPGGGKLPKRSARDTDSAAQPELRA